MHIYVFEHVDGSKPHLGGAQKDLQNLTVERLRALLREKGLSLRGRKASIWHCEQHVSLQVFFLKHKILLIIIIQFPT